MAGAGQSGSSTCSSPRAISSSKSQVGEKPTPMPDSTAARTTSLLLVWMLPCARTVTTVPTSAGAPAPALKDHAFCVASSV
jgi:hypothetical protein